MNCPKCQNAMLESRFDDVTIDRCPQCNGLWFDSGEAEILSDRWIAEFIDTGDALIGNAMDDVPTSGCPRCGKTMQRATDRQRSLVQFEQCDAHGKFFDAGEFTLWAVNQFL